VLLPGVPRERALTDQIEHIVGQRQTFREWLIGRIMGTAFATATIEDHDIDAIAHEMGIEPQTLLEARLRVVRERAERGRAVPEGVKRAGSHHYQFDLWMPEAIHKTWREECARRGLLGSTLLRSMLHAYLIGSWEPRTMSKKWVWRGVGYEMRVNEWKKEHGSRYPYRERALVTRGARRALARRAGRRAAQPTAVARALVLACIDGRWAQPGTIDIVDSTDMYDDEARYFLG